MRATCCTNQISRVLVAGIMLIFLAGSVNAQIEKFSPKKLEKAVENLVVGIQSDNEGVKRDCIYLAAKYQFSETVDVLISQLKSEKNSKNRILIALALYRIGEERGIQAVYDAAVFETDAKVKRTYNAIVSEFKAAKSMASNK